MHHAHSECYAESVAHRIARWRFGSRLADALWSDSRELWSDSGEMAVPNTLFNIAEYVAILDG